MRILRKLLKKNLLIFKLNQDWQCEVLLYRVSTQRTIRIQPRRQIGAFLKNDW